MAFVVLKRNKNDLRVVLFCVWCLLMGTKEADLVLPYPFTVAPVSQRVSGGTFSATLEMPSFIISTSTPGANKIAEYALVTHDSDDPFEMKLYPGNDVIEHTLSRPNRIGGHLGIYTLRSNLTDTQYVGIELGSIDQAPPFIVPSAGGVCQVRWKASTDRFELYVAKGDGTVEETIPLEKCTGIYDSSNIPHGVFAELEWDPDRQKVKAFINGVCGAEYSGPSFPDLGSISHTGSHTLIAGIFVTTGSSSSGATNCWFNGFEYTLPGYKHWNYEK